jgi:hypothetical protein
MNFENSLTTQKITASNAQLRDFSQNNSNRVSKNWGPHSRAQKLTWIDFTKINKY